MTVFASLNPTASADPTTVRFVEGAGALVIRGPLGITSGVALRAALGEALVVRPRRLELDLRALSAIDPGGVEHLMTIGLMAGRMGCQLVASGLTTDEGHVFALTGLDRVISVNEPASSKRDPADTPGGWAPAREAMHVEARARASATVDAAAAKLVEGVPLAGPLDGFGQLWRKLYRVRLGGASNPEDVVATWKRELSALWPEGSGFAAPGNALAPGDVALVEIEVAPGARLASGVLVLYADATSFTLMTPRSHTFCGWITLRATHRGEQGTVAAARVFMRANDPVAELGLAFGGHGREDAFWQETLTNLARRFDVAEPEVSRQRLCVDAHRRWRAAADIRHNGVLRTFASRVGLGAGRPRA